MDHPEPMCHDLDDWITIAEAAGLVRRTTPRAVRYWTAGDNPNVPATANAHGVTASASGTSSITIVTCSNDAPHKTSATRGRHQNMLRGQVIEPVDGELGVGQGGLR